MTATMTIAPPTEKLVQVPEHLVAEVIDGRPFYFAGFRDVLNKTKTSEEIMADSGLQTLLKTLIRDLLLTCFSKKEYWIFAGETGAHIDHRNNLSLDVVVYEKAALPAQKITVKYLDVPPKLVMEIDVNVEPLVGTGSILADVIVKKTQRLLDFGVEQVIWMLSYNRKVVVARPNQSWQILGLDDDIALLNGAVINLGKFLAEQGVQLPEIEEADEA